MWTVRATSSTITAALTAACASLPIVNGPWLAISTAGERLPLRGSAMPRPIESSPISANGPTGTSPPNASAIMVSTQGMGGGGARRRSMAALAQCAEEVGDDHVRCRQLVVGDSRGFDHHEVVPGHAGRHVAGGPDDQSVSRELATVSYTHLRAHETGR